jgi:serine/threonine-protein kinase
MSATPQKIGKYVIEELLGKGGMGEVYKAHDATLGRYVALKLMRGPALDDTNARERFVREAQAAGGLRHPNIVTVYDLGEFEGQMYIAMEFIHGEDLEKIISNKTPLLIEDKLNIMIQVCEGVEYAHRHEIVHRDLKPSNIRIDEEGIAKIMDFGIAKLGSSTMTASGTVMGTPFYMSPEQVRGMKVDARSDLFSLGAILYEFFTYHKAFSGEMTAVFYKIAHEQPAPISEYLNIPSGQLQAILDVCLEKDKSKRIQSASDLANMLRHAQTVLRSSDNATVSGIKATAVQEGGADFRLNSAPTAVSGRRSQTQPTATGSEPTRIADQSRPPAAAPTELIGSQPTSLLTDPPVQPEPQPSPTPAVQPISAISPTGIPVASQTFPRQRSSKALLLTGLLLFLILAGGVGAYLYIFRGTGDSQQGGIPPGDKTQPPEQKKETPSIPKPQEPPGQNPGSTDISKELDNAKALYQEGKYDEAGVVYEQLVQKQPSNAQLHFFLGAARQKMQKNQEALLEFEKAVAIDPRLAKAWQQIGYILMNRMDYKGAEAAFLKAINSDPNSAANWEGLAQTYLINQQEAKAESAYKKLLEIEPNNIPALYNLGRIQWGRKDAADAKESFSKVLQLNPNYAEAHNNLGAIYLSEGKLAQSILENEKAIELKPSLYPAHYSLYLAYDQQKDFKQAAAHLKEYLRLSDDDDPKLKQKLKDYGSL